MIEFTEAQLERYGRNILIHEIGIEGQKKILSSNVVIIGVGGLGSPAALYLAAAGIGTIVLVDGDEVELSNLQRQIIHFTKDISKPKVISASDTIKALNSDVKVEAIQENIAAHTIRDIIQGSDFVIDGTDNFEAKFLINDACVLENIPFSHGGILNFTGQTLTVTPNTSACYRCVFTQPPPPDELPSCSQQGVLGSIAGMVGTIQATEALKYIAGAGTLLSNRLLTFDALHMEFRTVPVSKRESCQICGNSPSIISLG